MSAIEVVPWICKQEWEFCRDNLFGNDIALKRKALQHLYIWKIRSSNLPVSIECTLILMEVYLKETEEKGTISELKTTTMSFESWYSMSIMRFLNLIMDSSVGPKCASSMNELAQQFSIPEWIVELRHTAAHGHSLPNLTRLREATEFCLNFLYENYWCKDSYQDVGTTQYDEGSASFTILCYDIYRLVHRYMLRGFRNLSDVESNDREIICKIITRKIHNKEQDEIDRIKLNHICEITRTRLNRHILNNIKNAELLADHILKTEERLIQPNMFENDKLLPQARNEWKDLLSILCDSDGSFYFLKQLSNIVIDHMELTWRKKCAAQFLNYILESMLICKQKNLTENISKKALKRKFKEETKRDPELKPFVNIHTIRVSTSELTELLVLLLEEPNEFVDIFLKNFLNVLDIRPGSGRFRRILKLVDIYNGKLKDNLSAEEDINTFTLRDALGELFQPHEKDSEMPTDMENNIDSDKCIWTKTPLGRLPWQTDFQPWFLIYESEE